MSTSPDPRATAGTAAILPVLDLGIAPYPPLQDLQQRLRVAVADGMLDGVILLLEHDPVITLGNRGGAADLRDADLARRRGVTVATSERGGQTTLHAPGQLILYPIVRIPHHDLRAFVRDLEEVFALVLLSFSVAAHRREGHPGLYVSGEKIMSVGLRCHRWVSSHGASFNVDPDLSLFDLIFSCGETDLRQTSLRTLTGVPWAMDNVKDACVAALAQVFGWRLATPIAVPYMAVEETLGLAP